ncbi:hypothetical protein CSA37_09365 [Candidatus Fermentibacteria bacterium]|nr:MAG: hypothetical protein CSA37_09365 [Candidatus Fermentibacteria bacterium]
MGEAHRVFGAGEEEKSGPVNGGMTLSLRDSAAVLVLFALLWAGVAVPVLSSPLGKYPVIDASWHFQWAEAVSRGDLFIYAPYFRAPLYPMVLASVFALTGPSVVAGVLLSFLLSAGAVHLVQRTVFETAGRTASFAAAAVTALNGVFLFYSSTLLITPLYIFLLVLSFYLFNRNSPSRWAWLVLGAAAVARPSAILLFPVSLFLFRKKLLKSAWLFLVPVASVWMINFFHGDFGTLISSQGGINLYIGSGPEADGYTAFAPETANEPLPVDSLPYTDNVFAASIADFSEEALPSAVSAFWTRRTLRYIMEHLSESEVLILKKMLLIVSPVAIPSNYDVYYFTGYSAVLGFLAGSPAIPVAGLIIWMAVPGALAAGGFRRGEKEGLLWALTLAAGILPFFVTARFVLPLLPFIVIVTVPRVLRTPARSMALAIPGLIAALVIAFHTGYTVKTGGVNMAFHDGIAHYRTGRSEESEILFLKALETAMNRTDGIDLNGTDALYNLGIIAAGRSDMEAAERWWTAALERDSGHSLSRVALEGLTRRHN